MTERFDLTQELVDALHGYVGSDSVRDAVATIQPIIESRVSERTQVLETKLAELQAKFLSSFDNGELKAKLDAECERTKLLRDALAWAMDLPDTKQMQHLVNGKAACKYCDGLFMPAGNPKKRRFVHTVDCPYEAARRALESE